jgi:hypothetical protein
LKRHSSAGFPYRTKAANLHTAHVHQNLTSRGGKLKILQKC